MGADGFKSREKGNMEENRANAIDNHNDHAGRGELAEKVTVNCQSSIRIEGTKVICFDPFQIKEERHDADVILITHEHYDHFQPESIAKIKKETTLLVAPSSMRDKVLKESGIAADQCVFLEPKQKETVDGIPVEAVGAYNKLKPFHPKAKNWLGYIVTLDEVRYYVAGDTDPNEDNRKVKCDVALIPIGGHYTMDKKHGADFVANLKPKTAIPTHYGEVVGTPEDGADFKDYVEIIDPEISVVLKL